MATQAKAHATGPGVLKFGTGETENDFSCQVSNVKITPDFDADDSIPVLCGGEVPGEVAYSAELEAEFLQDFDANGCLAWSWENAGKQVAFEFIPSLAHAAKFTGTVTVHPMEVGGDVRKKNTSSIKWPTVGLPVADFTAPAGPGE